MAWVIVTFKIPEKLLRRLDDVATSKGISRSEAIREAILEYVAKRNAPHTTWRVKRVVLR